MGGGLAGGGSEHGSPPPPSATLVRGATRDDVPPHRRRDLGSAPRSSPRSSAPSTPATWPTCSMSRCASPAAPCWWKRWNTVTGTATLYTDAAEGGSGWPPGLGRALAVDPAPRPRHRPGLVPSSPTPPRRRRRAVPAHRRVHDRGNRPLRVARLRRDPAHDLRGDRPSSASRGRAGHAGHLPAASPAKFSPPTRSQGGDPACTRTHGYPFDTGLAAASATGPPAEPGAAAAQGQRCCPKVRTRGKRSGTSHAPCNLMRGRSPSCRRGPRGAAAPGSQPRRCPWTQW